MLKVRTAAPLLRDLRGRFARVDEIAEEELGFAVQQSTKAVYRQAQRNIGRMFRNPGRMQSALKMTVRLGKRPIGEVSISGVENVIHETGGLRSYTIFPRNRSVLKFQGLVLGLTGGTRFGSVFAARVDRDPLPQRSYLRLALEQKRSEVRNILDEALRRNTTRIARG